MAIDTSMTTTTQLGQSLRVGQENGDQGKAQRLNLQAPKGDRISISSEGLEKSKESAVSSPEKSGEELIERIKKKIEELKKEIEALEKSNIPEKQKRQQIQSKQVQMMELQSQLQKAIEENAKESGMTYKGGTRAEGMGSSLT